MAKHVSLRVPEALWEALDTALTAGEGVKAAARALVDAADVQEQTLIHYEGWKETVQAGKRVALAPPQRNGDEVSVPVRLLWLKGRPLAEARSADPNHPRMLVEALLPLILPTDAVAAIDTVMIDRLGPRVDNTGHPVADGGLDIRNPTADARDAAIRRHRETQPLWTPADG